MDGRRLPDFVVIGVMKAGSTTLFRWLDEHPGVRMPADKEPQFFSDERAWRRGTSWYASLFADVPAGLRTGEASVAYADPRTADVVIPRLLGTLPDAALICLLRDPATRLRSHYRHEVLRGRETKPLSVAVAEPGNAYVARSSYGEVLRPWLAAAPDRLLVVVSEELFADETTWPVVLDHLGLTPEPRPVRAHNSTEGKAAFSPVMRRLWDFGLVESVGRRVPRPPKAVRGLARKALLRDPSRLAPLLESADVPLPDAIAEQLAAEVAEAERLLGRSLPYDVAPGRRP